MAVLSSPRLPMCFRLVVSGYQTHSTEETTCGWVTVDENNYYIMPVAKLSNADLYGAKLRDADLSDASLNRADLTGTDLTGAYLAGVKANSRTICPNAYRWGTSGNDCGF